MQPQIFIAGHDERLGLAVPATMAKPAATQAARYRSEVRRFVEALAAGRLDEDLVPEIETAFAELGRVAKLDFEAVRREVAEPSEAVRREVAGPSPSLAQTSRERTRARSGRPSDAVLVSELPDVFGWRDVAQAWSLGRAGAFARLEKLLEEHLIRGAGHGRYSPIVPKSKVQSPESKSPKVQKQPIRPEKSKVQRPKAESRKSKVQRPKVAGVALSHLNPRGPAMQTLRAFKSTGEARDAETMAVWVGKLRSAHPGLTDSHERELFEYLKSNFKTVGKKIRSYAAYREFVDQVIARRTVFGKFEAGRPLNFAEIKPESVATQRVNELLDRLRAEAKQVRTERDKALRGFVARREAGESFDMDRVMKDFREAVEAAERAQLQAEQESRAALDHLRGIELTLLGKPRRLPGIDFDVQYIYVGEVEEFVSTTARAVDAELFTTPSLDVALIVPKSRAKKGKRRRGRFDRALLTAFKEYHGREPQRRDFMLELPETKGRAAGEAVLLIYTTDKGGQEEYLYHFFDIGEGASRPVRRIKDVYVVEGLEMTFDGIIN